MSDWWENTLRIQAINRDHCLFGSNSEAFWRQQDQARQAKLNRISAGLSPFGDKEVRILRAKQYVEGKRDLTAKEQDEICYMPYKNWSYKDWKTKISSLNNYGED